MIEHVRKYKYGRIDKMDVKEEYGDIENKFHRII